MPKEFRQTETEYEKDRTIVLEIATDPKWAGIKPNIAKMILNLSGVDGLAEATSRVLKKKTIRHIKYRKTGNWQ